MPSWHRNAVRLLHNLLPWLALPILLLYTYLELFYAPYLGFSFSPSTGRVQELFANPFHLDLQADDVIVAVESITWDTEKEGLHNNLLSHAATGDVLHLLVARDEQRKIVDWQVPGFSAAELWSRLFNAWILGYIFWLAGAVTTLLVRPSNTRSQLFVAFFLLTAIWLVAGNTSRWYLWQSANVYRVAIWLAVPVYLHVHWLFPKPLATVPSLFWRAIYAATAMVAICQWFELVPRNAYAYALMVALVGSIVLLLIHYIRQPAERRHIQLLAVAFLFALIPLGVLAVVSALGSVPPEALLALASLPIVPIAYFYTIYRYQLGGLEFRANRLLSLYLFLILLGSVFSILLALISLLPNWLSKDILVGVTLGLLAALAGIYGFPPFERMVEVRLLGVTLPSTKLLATYAAHITTSLTQSDLARVLQEEILPSLLIRQSALLLVGHDRLTPLYAVGIEDTALPEQREVLHVLGQIDAYLPQVRHASPQAVQGRLPQAWIRAGIPIRFEARLVGAWLFGRRDPDDSYSLAELAMLQTIAHQTAIALINIEQSQQLQVLYEANIDRHEMERTHLAQLLHDDILGGLSLLKASSESNGQTDLYEKNYQVVKQRVMHMITGLRPAMLNYGLHAALEELTDDLNERADGMTLFQLEATQALIQLPPNLEEHIFRIIQQACENALRHSQADTICIAGSITDECIDLAVIDNGIGFDTADGLSIAHLLTQKHFGLVGMYERAKSISAKLVIESAPSQGTSVRVIWPSTALPASP